MDSPPGASPRDVAVPVSALETVVKVGTLAEVVAQTHGRQRGALRNRQTVQRTNAALNLIYGPNDARLCFVYS